MPNADVAIIGGGIVGLATAYNLSEQFPNRTVLILEKENGPAHHQTGHNSGVLHSGIYYKPGSSKAINCRNGKLAMEQFCRQQSIDFEICGKVIVAVDEIEVPAMESIYQRGCENGVQCEIIDRDRLSELEPHAAGVAALHVPEAGIVNYRQVCERLRDIVIERGGRFITGARVTGIRRLSEEIVLETSTGEHAAKFVVNCAGLYSDRVTRLGGQKPTAKIVPFRGEYYKLKDEAKHLCKNLIYPVPDPSFPFLGVHFTRMIDGSVECGPNAVLAFAREGYRMRDVNVRDLFESLTYSGFVRMALKYWRTGCGEMWRSFSKRAFVKALSRLLPDIRSEHLESAPAGVRAQAVTADGKMVDDFLIQETDRVVNVGNAPSPAATASLNIGRLIVEKLASRFE
jgi:L-2-hydroxyglutarate oxidase